MSRSPSFLQDPRSRSSAFPLPRRFHQATSVSIASLRCSNRTSAADDRLQPPARNSGPHSSPLLPLHASTDRPSSTQRISSRERFHLPMKPTSVLGNEPSPPPPLEESESHPQSPTSINNRRCLNVRPSISRGGTKRSNGSSTSNNSDSPPRE